MFRNTMPRYEILSADAVGVLERGWRRIVSEIGVQFAKPDAVELFRKAGQQVDGDVVKFDPDFVLEQVAKAPREFDVQARNPANSVHIGGDDMVFGAVYGSPFVREGEVRRDATLADFRRLAMLAQSFGELDADLAHDAAPAAFQHPDRVGGEDLIPRHRVAEHRHLPLPRRARTALTGQDPDRRIT